MKIYNIIENYGFNSTNSNNLKKIIETSYFVYKEFLKFENQQKIIMFVNNFYKSMLDKINRQLNNINDSHLKFKEKKLELEENFSKNLDNFKEVFAVNVGNSGNKDFTTDIKIIEKANSDFRKFFSIFEEKLKTFNVSYNNFKEKNTNKLKDNNLHPLPENSKETQIKVNEIYTELMKIKNNENVKESLLKIENIWNLYKLNSLVESFNNLFKLRRSNSSKIKAMLDDECLKLKKGILEKISEINFFKNNIENNLEVAFLPKIFKIEMKEIEGEIEKRREFDFIFQTVTNFLNNDLLTKEEKRRKE